MPITVMGLTGIGKSSLIKTLTGDKAVTVGDNLESGILPSLLHDQILFTEALCVAETQNVTEHHCANIVVRIMVSLTRPVSMTRTGPQTNSAQSS
jgi:ABC-type uncharacterized transport system ATPase component